MHIVGNIGQFFGARLAEFLTLGLIIVFSWRKGKTFPLRIKIFFRCLFLAVPFFLVAAVPAFVLFLVTNGDLSLFNVGRPGGWADRAALGWDFLILVFLIVVPNLLRHRIPWGSPGPAVQALLTTWFALFAAAATIGLVSTLHLLREGSWRRCVPRWSSPPPWASCP